MEEMAKTQFSAPTEEQHIRIQAVLRREQKCGRLDKNVDYPLHALCTWRRWENILSSCYTTRTSRA